MQKSAGASIPRTGRPTPYTLAAELETLAGCTEFPLSGAWSLSHIASCQSGDKEVPSPSPDTRRSPTRSAKDGARPDRPGPRPRPATTRRPHRAPGASETPDRTVTSHTVRSALAAVTSRRRGDVTLISHVQIGWSTAAPAASCE